MDTNPHLSAGDLCRLAADLADEHGDGALDVARRVLLAFEAEGAVERAQVWFMLCVFLADMAEYGLDPSRPVTLH
jgi:hypothetical protein